MNLRVDAVVKEQAGEVLEAIGMTFSEAFNLLLNQIRLRNRIPFDLVGEEYTPSAKTLAFIERFNEGLEPMVGPFKTFEEYQAYVDVYCERDDDDDDEI
jgi:addiction module RelB/DinJ family antitoxin